MKRHFVKHIGVMVLGLLALPTFGQDTIKVGINDQMIQVGSPRNNQKVTIIIEDSAANYKVDITRYTPSNSDNLKSDLLNRVKRKKNWTSRFFGEAEMGFSGLGFRSQFGQGVDPSAISSLFLDTIYLGPVGNYSTQTFSSTGQYFGAYVDLTVREKKRMLWKTDNIYLSNGTHMRF
ncbi:MAG: hypothetical protein JJ975_10575, partial [Bacteroidia bacterium]|nr:hypothetical protein [Bacteroidia bacterium]